LLRLSQILLESFKAYLQNNFSMAQIKFDHILMLKSLDKATKLNELLLILEFASKKFRGFTQTGLKTFAATGFEFKVGGVAEIDQERFNLERAHELGITCAPKIIDNRIYGDSALLVTCFLGCEYREPICCSTSYPILPSRAKNTFVTEMDLLAHNGLIHTAGMAGCTHWLLHPDRSHILLDCWDSLRTIEERELSRMAQSLPVLFDRYESDRKDFPMTA
jgi:hypothetical protein